MTHEEGLARALQANEISHIVIQELEPGTFAALSARYNIADAIWAAGYRKVEKA